MTTNGAHRNHSMRSSPAPVSVAAVAPVSNQRASSAGLVSRPFKSLIAPTIAYPYNCDCQFGIFPT